MGGGVGSSSIAGVGSSVACKEVEQVIKCQIYNQPTHLAFKCPFLYSSCRLCFGIHRVWESSTPENPMRLFLRCQHVECDEFQWLDEAITQSLKRGYAPKQVVIGGCFHCGGSDHWKKDCMYKSSPRSKAKVLSGKQLEDNSSQSRKVLIETTLDELCNKFTGCKVKK